MGASSWNDVSRPMFHVKQRFTANVSRRMFHVKQRTGRGPRGLSWPLITVQAAAG